MSTGTRLAIALLLSQAIPAGAQPRVSVAPSSPPNAAGWHNGLLAVVSRCEPAAPCPGPTLVTDEGRALRVGSTLTLPDGTTVSAAASLDVDRTPPVVELTSPADGTFIDGETAIVTARVMDTLSGVVRTTCNGLPATRSPAGAVRCAVALDPGVTDLVVEATDAAGNSGSAGVRVIRTAAVAGVRVLPRSATVAMGHTVRLQLVDAWDRRIEHVTWQSGNANLAEVTADGDLHARRPGTMTVIARHGGLWADATITIVEAEAVPAGGAVWRSDSLSLLALPQSRLHGPARSGRPLLLAYVTPETRQGRLAGFDMGGGMLTWSGRAAVAPSEMPRALAAQAIGGALLVVDDEDGRSALIRSGPGAAAMPWRYQAQGRIEWPLVQDLGGAIAILERREDGSPEIVELDGLTGRVRGRDRLPNGVRTLLDEGCVAGATGWEPIPAEAGPLTVQPADGALMFTLVRSDDVEDTCTADPRRARHRRVVEAVRIRPFGGGISVDMLRDFRQVGSAQAPEVTLFPIEADGADGGLAPWRLTPGTDDPVEHAVSHVTPAGVTTHAFRAVGPLFRLTPDLAAMTDGTTLVAFTIASGTVRWMRVFEEGAARIVGVSRGQLIVVSRSDSIRLDADGTPVSR